MTIQIKATEQYFPEVLFIMLYKVVVTIESVDEIPRCDHSNQIHFLLAIATIARFPPSPSRAIKIKSFVKFVKFGTFKRTFSSRQHEGEQPGSQNLGTIAAIFDCPTQRPWERGCRTN